MLHFSCQIVLLAGTLLCASLTNAQFGLFGNFGQGGFGFGGFGHHHHHRPPTFPVTSLFNECEDTLGCCNLPRPSFSFHRCVMRLHCRPACDMTSLTFLAGLLIDPTCQQAAECCEYDFLSRDFVSCCSKYGCCPKCDSIDSKGCRSLKSCRAAGGSCKKQCEDGESRLRGRHCRGRRCSCCVPETTSVDICTDNEAAQQECCQYDTTSSAFQTCCKTHGCCPVCDTNGCQFNNETFAVGTTVQTSTQKCYDLKCELAQLTVPPYYSHNIVQYNYYNSCDCCTLGGKMYENGYLLTEDDYCWALQCVDGEWVNQGFISSECRVCQVSDPSMIFKTWDNTFASGGEIGCTYSLAQDGSSTSPSFFVGADFQSANSTSQPSHLDFLNFYFKDTGADVVSCSADDYFNDCSFGPVTGSPTEINSQGTLAFYSQLGSSNRTVIQGVNKLTVVFSEGNMFIFGHLSLKDTLGGICGAYNEDPTDDLTTSSGNLSTDEAEYISSWELYGHNCDVSRRFLEHTNRYPMSCNDCNMDQCKAMGKTFITKDLTTCWTATEAIMEKYATELSTLDEADREYIIMDLRTICMKMSCICQGDVCYDHIIKTLEDNLVFAMRIRDPSVIALLLAKSNRSI